jgi:hypothetical protein
MSCQALWQNLNRSHEITRTGSKFCFGIDQQASPQQVETPFAEVRLRDGLRQSSYQPSGCRLGNRMENKGERMAVGIQRSPLRWLLSGKTKTRVRGPGS